MFLKRRFGALYVGEIAKTQGSSPVPRAAETSGVFFRETSTSTLGAESLSSSCLTDLWRLPSSAGGHGYMAMGLFPVPGRATRS